MRRLRTAFAGQFKRHSTSVPTYVPGFHDKQAVEQMQYRALGNTGMQLSKISLGASAIGGAFGEVDLATSKAVVCTSLKAGINYIDSAPWYGHGRSEEFLGEALRGVPRDAFYLATKVGRYEANITEMFDFSAERTARSVDESLQRTGLEYIDLIQVHDPEFAPNPDVKLPPPPRAGPHI